MLCVSNATRASFAARKFNSLLALEQLKIPVPFEASAESGRRAVEGLVPARGTEGTVLANQRLGETLVFHRHGLSSSFSGSTRLEAVPEGYI
jgi:hypothetical protein